MVKKGIREALDQLDEALARRRLAFAREGITDEAQLSDVIAEVDSFAQRLASLSAEQWQHRLTQMREDISLITSMGLSNKSTTQIQDVVNQWVSWTWHDEVNERQFHQYLIELSQQADERRMLGAQALLQLHVQGVHASPPPVAILWWMADDPEWTKEIINKLSMLSEESEQDLLINVLLSHFAAYQLGSDDIKLKQSGISKRLESYIDIFDQYHEILNEHQLHYLRSRFGMFQLYNQRDEVIKRLSSSRSISLQQLHDAMWSRQHHRVDEMAEEILAINDSSYGRMIWAVSLWYRSQFDDVLSVIDGYSGEQLSTSLRALKVAALNRKGRDDEAREIALRVLAQPDAAGQINGLVMDAFTIALDDLALLEQREYLVRQIAAHNELDWWRQLAMVSSLRRSGQLEDALDKSFAVLSRWPQFHFGYAEQAEIYRLMGRYEEAVQSADKALSIMPRNAGLLSTHGVTLLHQHPLEHAFARFIMAGKMKPDFIYGWQQLAMWSRATKWQGITIQAFQRWHRENREDFAIARTLWRLLLENGLTNDLLPIIELPHWNHEQRRALWNMLFVACAFPDEGPDEGLSSDLPNLPEWPTMSLAEAELLIFEEVIAAATADVMLNDRRQVVRYWLNRYHKLRALSRHQFDNHHKETLAEEMTPAGETASGEMTAEANELTVQPLIAAIEAWLNADQQRWQEVVTSFAPEADGTSNDVKNVNDEENNTNDWWLPVAESAEKQTQLLQYWSTLPELPSQALPWPEVRPGNYHVLWSRTRPLYGTTFWQDATTSGLQQLWTEQYQQWVADTPSPRLSSVFIASEAAPPDNTPESDTISLTPEQHAELLQWFNELQLLSGDPPTKRQMNRRYPSIDAGWDFPPASYRSRKDQTRKLNGMKQKKNKDKSKRKDKKNTEQQSQQHSD